ncbi:MAG TPA: flippase-like domain-containing protein [Chthoniobacterales bacterium]|jgi:putative membrane protein|nr:flippase-like domain-containing protein [Chthoniobacterales bacterium]
MKAPGKFKLAFYLFGFGGAALFTALLIRQGVSAVALAVATAGWAIAAIALYHLLVPVFLDALAWWVLFPSFSRPLLRKLFWMRWVGESVSTLVPSAAVGGDIIRARLATIDGAPLALSAGTVLVDVTLGVFTQAAFTLLGLVLLVDVTGQRSFVGPTLLGTLAGVAAVGGFYFVQRMGMFRFLATIIAKLASSDEWNSLIEGGTTLDQTIRDLYARKRGVIGCCAVTVVSLIGGSGEIWIALHALGLNASLIHAVILQSMALTIRSVAFPVPGGLGVQEGGYVVVGNFLGIPGDAAFALSLIARVRELTIGVPGLLIWQIVEGRRLLSARSVEGATVEET